MLYHPSGSQELMKIHSDWAILLLADWLLLFILPSQCLCQQYSYNAPLFLFVLLVFPLCCYTIAANFAVSKDSECMEDLCPTHLSHLLCTMMDYGSIWRFAFTELLQLCHLLTLAITHPRVFCMALVIIMFLKLHYFNWLFKHLPYSCVCGTHRW